MFVKSVKSVKSLINAVKNIKKISAVFIHEYQAKNLFKNYGLNVLEGKLLLLLQRR